MPAPKKTGTMPISLGIKHNRKFNFYLFFRCFNTKNTPDDRQFFNTLEEATSAYQNYINSLNNQNV